MFQSTCQNLYLKCLSVVAFASVAVPLVVGQSTDVNQDKHFAIVELFTSQGCSSCPPADKLLRQIVENNERSGRRVYALSFHVDYWNRLGWRDPFSSPEASKRQRAYAGLMKSQRVYTPQMIVGGTTEFVGSNGKLAKAAIDQSFSRQQTGRLTETSTDSSGNKIVVQITAEDIAEGALINFALVESEATTVVSRGENANRTLSHRNVVRDFRIQTLSGTRATATLTRPQDAEQLIVVVYAQDAKTGEILAAVDFGELSSL